MDELVIYLEENTNPDDFVAWLDAYFSKRHSEEYPYAPGVNVVMIYYALGAKQAKIGATADRVKLKKIDDDNEILESENIFQIDNAIVISWLKVGSRLKVMLKHYGARWVIPPVFNLLAEIGKDWEQSADDVWKIIQEQAQKYHIEITSPPYKLSPEATKMLESYQLEQYRHKLEKDRPLHTLPIALSLATTYREFIEWLKKEYPEIKIEYYPGNLLELVVTNGLEKAQISIVSLGQSIKIDGFCEFYGADDWVQVFEQRCKNYFGEVEIAEKLTETAKQEPPASKGKPGARHKPDDIWAWKQMHQLGRNEVEVKPEWLQKVRADQLRMLAYTAENRQWRRIRDKSWLKKDKKDELN